MVSKNKVFKKERELFFLIQYILIQNTLLLDHVIITDASIYIFLILYIYIDLYTHKPVYTNLLLAMPLPLECVAGIRLYLFVLQTDFIVTMKDSYFVFCAVGHS